jgi:hypothetical protein
MAISSEAGRLGHVTDTTGGEPPLGLPNATLAVVNLGALLHPNALVLPALSAILVTAGLMLAGFQLLRSRSKAGGIAERMALPGLLVFHGFVAAVLCDSERVAEALARLSS